MAFVNKYPYTDFEQLNLDWVIDTINRVDTDLSGIQEACEEIARTTAQDIADTLTAEVNAKIKEVNDTIDELEQTFNDTITQLEDDYQDFVDDVNGKLQTMRGDITTLQTYIDEKVAVSDALTDTKIARNNTYIFDVITHELVPQLTVIDYFSGNSISIQAMFDKLAQLHVTDGIDYATLTQRNKTYADLSALNITYEDLLMHGNSLII